MAAKKRTGRITYKQQELILESIEKNSILLTKSFSSEFTKEDYEEEWKKLSKNLNASNYQLNARTYDKWQKVKLFNYFLQLIKIN